MELNIKKKSYRWNNTVSRETTLKIVECFIEKRSLDLLTPGLKLLNESIQECGLQTRLSTWDKRHPLTNEVESTWLDYQTNEQRAFARSIVKHNGHLEKISSTLEAMLELMGPEDAKPVLTIKTKPVRKKIAAVEQPIEVQPIDEIIDISKDGLGWSKEDQNGSLENKKELGMLFSAARGKLNVPGQKMWSGRRVAEAINASPLAYEGYLDYTGKIRNPISAPTICFIENGKYWPCAKALHALIEFYKLSNGDIERILGLLPAALLHSVKMNLPEEARIRQILVGEIASIEQKVESPIEIPPLEPETEIVDEFETELPETKVPEELSEGLDVLKTAVEEKLGITTSRTPPLKIAVLGQLDKATKRAEEKGFGRHTVLFIDGDRPKAIPSMKFDAVVALNRLGHAPWARFNVLCDYPPQLRFERNGTTIRNLNGLRRWLEMYDQGLVYLW